MPTGQYNHPLFGWVKFKTKSSKWVFGDPITFIDGFDSGEVVKVFIPQLKNVKGANSGNLMFHTRGHKQLKAAFEDIERLGLLKHIASSAGAYFPRLKKPVSGRLSKEPSNHSFGIAIDLNSDDGCLGCTTAPFSKIFESYGFRWGKAFNDPMHYEVIKFIDNAEPSVKEVALSINGKPSDAGATTLLGDLFFDLRKIEGIRGLKISGETSDSVSLKGRKGTGIFEKIQIGDLSLAPLPQALGLAGLKTKFDNSSKKMEASDLNR